MKKIIVLIMLLIITLSTQVFAKSFSDLNSNHWAHESISKMTNNGIISGYPDGTFKPERSVTRAEFSKILVKALELTNRTTFDLEDVTTDFWGYNDVKIASNYLSSYEKNGKIYFMPNDYAIREDVAVAVVKALGFSNVGANYDVLNQFSDKNDISVSLRDYVSIAVENGLMKGNANGTFNPKGKLTRAETAQLIINALTIKERYEEESGLDIKLNNIKYNSKTSTIDLGENWREYGIGIEYDNKTNKYVAKYRPIRQIITITEDMSDNVNLFTTDKNGEESYLTIARLDDLENYVKVECENPFENVKYNSKKGYIDFGEDFSKYVYYVSYTSLILDDGTTLTETEPINFLLNEGMQKTLNDRRLSVYTNDLGSFAGPDCYVPFIIVGLKDNVTAVKVIDTREDIEKYLKTDMKDITKEISKKNEVIELEYSFTKKIRNIEIYVEKGAQKELITLNNGLALRQEGKKCAIEFEADIGETYNVILNVTYLEGVNEILTSSSQKINVIKTAKEKENEKVNIVKTKASKPNFEVDAISSKIIVEDFDEFKNKYEYCYASTSYDITDKYQDFKSENDLIIKNENTLYIRVKESEKNYASEPFTVRKLTGQVLGITDCKKSYDSDVLYREIIIKDFYNSEISFEKSIICSKNGREKYNSLIAKETTIDSREFDISVGDTVTMFKYNYTLIALEEEGLSSYATLISNVALEEKSKSVPMFYINSQNKKVESLSEVSVVVNKNVIPENSYVSITVKDKGEVGLGISRRIDTITVPILLSDIMKEKEEQMVGKCFEVDVVVGEKSFSNDYYQREIKEFYWTNER